MKLIVCIIVNIIVFVFIIIDIIVIILIHQQLQYHLLQFYQQLLSSRVKNKLYDKRR